MSDHKSTLTIVIPCYNPAQAWEISLAKRINLIASDFPKLNISTVLVNDGSTRGVSEAATDYMKKEVPHFTIINHEVNRGKGAAVRTGIDYLKSDYYIYSDVDFPYTQQSIYKIINELLEGTEMAIAVKDLSYYKEVPFMRKLISKGLRLMIELALGIPNSDTQCGLKGFGSNGKATLMRTTIDSYLFDLQWIVLSERKKISGIRYIPCTLREGVVFSNVSLRMMTREAFNFFHILFTR